MRLLLTLAFAALLMISGSSKWMPSLSRTALTGDSVVSLDASLEHSRDETVADFGVRRLAYDLWVFEVDAVFV